MNTDTPEDPAACRDGVPHEQGKATHFMRRTPKITVAVTRETDDLVWYRLVTDSEDEPVTGRWIAHRVYCEIGPALTRKMIPARPMDDEYHTSRGLFETVYGPLAERGGRLIS